MTIAPPQIPSTSGAPRWWLRMCRDKAFWVALIGLAFILIVVTAGPWLSPYTESEQDLYNAYAGPSAAHWMGSDALGRDLMTRVLYGGRISLAVGAMGALVSLLIGVTVGGVAGLRGGWVEATLMRLVDFLYAVPLLLVVIALMVVTGPRLTNIFIALGLVYWLQMARVVRVRVAELRTREFVEAARALGAGFWRIFRRHILPNTTGVVVVTATFMIPQAIFTESFLSFIGLGVSAPHASWGTLASEGLVALLSHPHVLTFPAISICITMFLFQTLGESLRSALDPHQAERD